MKTTALKISKKLPDSMNIPGVNVIGFRMPFLVRFGHEVTKNTGTPIMLIVLYGAIALLAEGSAMAVGAMAGVAVLHISQGIRRAWPQRYMFKTDDNSSGYYYPEGARD